MVVVAVIATGVLVIVQVVLEVVIVIVVLVFGGDVDVGIAKTHNNVLYH